MIEFLAAHKVGLLLGAVLAGGLIFYMRKRGGSAAYANGVPVDPYAANANPESGGFDLGSLLPSGPAGPVLDPAQADPGNTSGDTPAAVDQASATPGPQAQAIETVYQEMGSPAYQPGSISTVIAALTGGSYDTHTLNINEALNNVGTPPSVSLPVYNPTAYWAPPPPPPPPPNVVGTGVRGRYSGG